MPFKFLPDDTLYILKVVFESTVDTQCGQRDRPKSLHFHISRGLISNVRSSEGCSRADLALCVNSCQIGSLFYGSESAEGPPVISDKFINHFQGTYVSTNPAFPLF